jgi:hypothetical protein
METFGVPSGAGAEGGLTHRRRRLGPKPPVTYTGNLQLDVPSPNNPDVAWLQERTSAPNPWRQP